MPAPQNEFKYLTKFSAEALGAPGHRTFRIMTESGSRSAVLWVEKEQLLQLAVALRHLVLSSEVGVQHAAPLSERRGRSAGVPANLEFKVGRMLLGQDSASGNAVIDAHDVESEPRSDPDAPSGQAVLRVWITRAQAEGFAQQALEVCAAGRPLCPLCDGPIDAEGHVCPRKNGHYKDSRQL